jgi:hypothetical protein
MRYGIFDDLNFEYMFVLDDIEMVCIVVEQRVAYLLR